MEVLFMDKKFVTTKIIDAFTSCIWNVNYIGYGDFELYFPMDYDSLTGINIGGYAMIRESDRYMVIESIDVQTSVEEGNYLIVTGRSLESLLERRIIRDKTILTGSLQDCIMRILNANAIYPSDENRFLDGLAFKKSTDPAVTNLTLDFELEAGDNLYDAVTTICDAYKLGFRILPLTDGKMEFELYAGVDRSYSQETNPWIVFSPKFENLKESEMIVDTSSLKNVCLSDLTIQRQVVDSNGEVSEEEEHVVIQINGKTKGLDRREIYVDKSRGVRVESIRIEDFGKPEDRVNIMDFMTYEVVHFNSAQFKADTDAYWEKNSGNLSTYEKEHWEWTRCEHTPEWQEEHPGENPYFWQGTLIPGDSADTVRRKQAHDAAIYANAPKKEDYYEWDWVLSDSAGYNAALRKAQQDINAEFTAAVTNAVNKVTSDVREECEAELAKHISVSKFIGNIDANVNYKFGVDYGLGDLVQIVNEYNYQAKTRITGMLFGQDTSSGFIMRPTFKSDDEAVFEI